jgi:hypothetical protein
MITNDEVLLGGDNYWQRKGVGKVPQTEPTPPSHEAHIG